MKPLDILILGASYGSLLGTKLALGGHNVKLVCLPAEAEPSTATARACACPSRAVKA